MREFWDDITVKLPFLWEKVPAEARFDLVIEALTNPDRFRRRYANERKFRDDLESRWRSASAEEDIAPVGEAREQVSPRKGAPTRFPSADDEL